MNYFYIIILYIILFIILYILFQNINNQNMKN